MTTLHSDAATSPRSSHPPSVWWTVTALVRTARGHPAPIDEMLR